MTVAIDKDWIARHALPSIEGETDKNKRGKVLVAGGSESVPGALLLTAEAAFRVGAGKVQIAAPARAALALGLHMPEAAVFDLPVNDDGELAATAGDILIRHFDHCDVMVIGPGMSATADTDALLQRLSRSARSEGILLLDAAMIAAVRGVADEPATWAGRLVLTPHYGEMAALMGCDEKAVSPKLAQEAADRFNAVVVLKAAETWIASPGGMLAHYAGGGSGLATAGSGDVLAGLIGGLLARGVKLVEAAAWGVWVHGEAGKYLTRKMGPLGFLARELLPAVPSLITETGLIPRHTDTLST